MCDLEEHAGARRENGECLACWFRSIHDEDDEEERPGGRVLSAAARRTRSIPCPECGVSAGDPCKTKSGIINWQHHSQRRKAAREGLKA